MKKCSAPLIREIQIKTTMRFHLVPIRMAITQKTKATKFWQRSIDPMLSKLESLHTVDGIVKRCSRCRKQRRFFRKLKLEQPYNPAIPLLSIYPKE